MIKAVIFDMDGLLIDSEPFWHEAEKKLFLRYGVPPREVPTLNTLGLRVDEIVEYFYDKFPWETPTKKEAEKALVETMVELLSKTGEPMPGAIETIKKVKAAGIPTAIASSSFTQIIDAVVDRLQIRDLIDVIHSAEHEEYGKPHPGVYITAAKKLNVAPVDCLAFEDSPNGLLSAKAARMTCIAVPGMGMDGDKRFAIADVILSSLEEFQIEEYLK